MISVWIVTGSTVTVATSCNAIIPNCNAPRAAFFCFRLVVACVAVAIAVVNLLQKI